jgi:hypothetical protein
MNRTVWKVCLLVAWCGSALAASQEAAEKEVAFRVAVDPRVELLGILFRLAGNREYNQARITGYAADVDKHFGPVRDHAAVAQARSLRDHRGVAYDACMSMAIHLTDVDTLRTKMPLKPWPEGLDRRWPAEEVPGFLAAAKQFATDAKFAQFFEAHRSLYQTTESRLRELIRSEAHLEWFADFFGQQRQAVFQVIPAILNGPQSYGPHCRNANGTEDLFCILGVWQADRQGYPTFTSEMLGVVIHEFCHSYANHLVDRHTKELQPAGEKLFRIVAAEMRAQAYNHWKIMMCESLVRASVLRYCERFQYRNVVWQALRQEKARGFVWIEGLSALLGDYEKRRAEYPTLDSFFPQIVKFLDNYAEEAVARDAALAGRRPKVVSINPPNGAADVDPGLTEIHVKFDRLMNISSWTVVGGGPAYPEIKGPGRYDLTRTIWTIPVKLKPDWDYEFMLNSSRHQGFQALDGTPLEPVHVRFHTAKQPSSSPGETTGKK